MIYFIRCEPDGPVKIGWSDNVVQRAHQVKPHRSANMTIIRLVDAPKWAERWFHWRFNEQHLHGEWFSYDEEMMNLNPPDQKPDIPIIPRLKNPRSAKVMIRLSKAEYDLLSTTARKSMRSMSDLIRLFAVERARQVSV